MRNLIVVLTLILSLNAIAQNAFGDKNILVRVYDVEGKKVRKGKVVSISETYLYFLDKKDTWQIFVNRIGKIKTKRSGGHNVLVGAATVGVITAVRGAATADPDTWLYGYTAAEGGAAGLLLGGTAGALPGEITTIFKNSKTYVINGNVNRFKAFREAMLTK